MGLGGYLSLFAAVLLNWKVIAVTLVSFLIIAVLRYVGMVYRRPKTPRSRVKGKKAKPAPVEKRKVVKAPDEDEEYVS